MHFRCQSLSCRGSSPCSVAVAQLARNRLSYICAAGERLRSPTCVWPGGNQFDISMVHTLYAAATLPQNIRTLKQHCPLACALWIVHPARSLAAYYTLTSTGALSTTVTCIRVRCIALLSVCARAAAAAWEMRLQLRTASSSFINVYARGTTGQHYMQRLHMRYFSVAQQLRRILQLSSCCVPHYNGRDECALNWAHCKMPIIRFRNKINKFFISSHTQFEIIHPHLIHADVFLCYLLDKCI